MSESADEIITNIDFPFSMASFSTREIILDELVSSSHHNVDRSSTRMMLKLQLARESHPSASN